METPNKLELKHLTPYLPYGLKMFNEKSGNIETVKGVVHWFPDVSIQVMSDGKSKSLDIWPLKPILRPLSDWNKWYKDNYMQLRGLRNSPFGFYEISFNEYDNLLAVFSDHEIAYSVNLSMLPILSIVFENHFDIFGLIPAGLAIDINTLDK